TEETPTVESVKADLANHLVAAKAKVDPLAAAVKTAERKMGDVAVAHAKNPNLAALVEASGILTKANDELAGATAGVTRMENKLASIEKDVQREADHAVRDGLVAKAKSKCPDVRSIHAGLSVSGTIPVADLNPTKDELAMCERHDIHVVNVATVRAEGEPPLLNLWYFPKKGKRVSSGRSGGNGGGRFVNVSPDGSQRLSDREFVELVGPKHIGDEKTQHALTAPGGTLYVTARSLQTKAGWTREQK
ncbi:unnamed protein product, partial [marine sediment metagenome]